MLDLGTVVPKDKRTIGLTCVKIGRRECHCLVIKKKECTEL